MGSPARTLSQKVWERHVVHRAHGEPDLLYVDLHLVHEVTSPQAFDGLRLAGRGVRRPDLTIATADHNVPTTVGRATATIEDEVSRQQLDALTRNCEEFAIPLYDIRSPLQGIVHVIGPDEKTVAYLRGRPHVPKGAEFDRLAKEWLALPSDPGAEYDQVVVIDASELVPHVTWGTNPGMVAPVTGRAPRLDEAPSPAD